MSTILTPWGILTLLSNSELDRGTLYVTGLTESETRRLAKSLRNAIIDYKIPFFKPIGINISGLSSNSDVLTMIKGMNGCLADLFISAENICFSRGKINEHFSEGLRQRRSAVTEEFCVICNDNKGTITSSDSWSMCGFGENVESLVLDKPFVKTNPNDSNSIIISMVCERTNGHISHEEAIQVIGKKTDTVYVPLSTTYSLDDYILVDMENVKSGAIHILYKEKISEKILHDILKRFGEEVGKGIWG